jgi:type I restriction enzyme S subunit
MKNNWQIKEIDDVCEVEYGTRVVNKRDGGSVYSVYGGGGATFHMDTFNREDRMVVARFAMSERCTRFVKGKFFLNDSGLTLSPKNKESMNQHFLDWQLLSLNDLIYSLAKGSAQKNLDLPAFRKVNITYPESIDEQKRIVKKLDKIFEELEEAKETAEKNLQNTRELFESYLNNLFSLPRENWITQKLVNVTSKIGSGATPRGGQKSYKETGMSLVRSMNVHDRRFVDKKLALIDKAQADALSNVALEAGDVLLNITGASVARSCVLPKEYLPGRVNQHVSIIRVNKDILDFQFLNYLLTSKIYKDKLLIIGGQGATRQAITKKQLEELVVSFPETVVEQKNLVKKLESLSLEVKKLEEIYMRKITTLEELKKSVLAKAFSGEL